MKIFNEFSSIFSNIIFNFHITMKTYFIHSFSLNILANVYVCVWVYMSDISKSKVLIFLFNSYICMNLILVDIRMCLINFEKDFIIKLIWFCCVLRFINREIHSKTFSHRKTHSYQSNITHMPQTKNK